MPGGFKVLDASRQQADLAKVLTFDQARRIAVNVAKLTVASLLASNLGIIEMLAVPA